MRCLRKLRIKTICAAAAVAAASMGALPPLTAAEGADEAAQQTRPTPQGDPWIGVRCADLPPLLRAQLDLPEGQGVLVDEVVADAPAQRAGLKSYDVIFAVDGKPIGDPRTLAAAVAKAEDREIKIAYLRGGRKETVSLKPTARPDSLDAQRQDQRAIRQWVERLGHGPAPMNFRFFHPGMVLPPGVSIAPALPDDMTVTIEKHGQQPAKVAAKQGDKTWEATEESLEKLPLEARQFAERMLGLGGFDLDRVEPRPAWPPVVRAPDRHAAESGLDRRFDEMNRQIEALRKTVEKLQSRD